MHYRYKDFDLSKVHDLIAFRVITEETGDCYIVMGIIHKHFTPLINKIKDYIALPKFN
jgi:GTP pyrophosphokinase